ncbi:MAG: hypothetical protein KDA24_16995 [Deltaproteobacteria bacterium]|nr:hypothetical protein [Deltaproteobacteria bacterium]
MRFLRALVLILVAALFVTSAPTDADAARANSIKFWASEFKITQEMPQNVAEGEIAIPTMSLEIKGRASAYGGEKVDFEYKVPDARLWLDMLQACSGSSARLSGVIAANARIDEDSKMIEGKGGLQSLVCRQILK